jgi:hypothetical protein
VTTASKAAWNLASLSRIKKLKCTAQQHRVDVEDVAASSPDAWLRRNSRQVLLSRPGAEPSSAADRIRRIVPPPAGAPVEPGSP